MEGEQQQRYYQLGQRYWWLAGKYRIVEDVIARAFRTNGARPRLLDLGCGPGNLLDALVRFGQPIGSDFSHDALRFCRERGYRRLVRADFHTLPLTSDSFDLITCLDVLEHLEDDRRAVGELARILRPRGLLVMTIPAFQSLWGDHDELYGHFRRYRAPEIAERLQRAGLEILQLTYFEPLYFLPLWLYRKWKRKWRTGSRSGELAAHDDFVSVPAPVNAVLTHVLAAERFVIRHVNLPFGVTLLAVARKPDDGRNG
jgi:SAM-dependent methyltransferase